MSVSLCYLLSFIFRVMHPAPSLGPTPTRYCHPNSYPTYTKHIQVGFVRGLTNHINVAKFIRYERHTHTHTHTLITVNIYVSFALFAHSRSTRMITAVWSFMVPSSL